ncbi:multidrug ABC transporter ATP-binding protein [Marinococcus halophilus]|uniref:Putative ABC transporter ATP-binding protein YfmR n=2 Tax=Marinococcus halophilus TaxID=1371 RepID=A0A510Y5H9_MARHA|nr:ABC-F family ATP-binding cassette domain-containing protein [Marinococcus halophilus]OZT78958.1 multidrug ABC transporter ATP-binding protein [Marinococcus halophilus]GEK58598.1 putative ABC transporter ATP-binding protein YfmR [Marinococcus halophilus]
MSLLVAENLYQTTGTKVLFDHISFTIEPGDRIGLIGVNGTGKSSLLRVISEIDASEKGKLQHSKQLRIEYLPQDPELPEEENLIDYLYEGSSDIMKAVKNYEKAQARLEEEPESEATQEQWMKAQQKMDQLGAWEAGTVAQQVLNRLGLTVYNQKINELSGGQRKRASIARALIQDCDILILDEPTNHLDDESINWLEKYLSSYNGALILVTHDRYFLNRVTNKIFELERGRLHEYDGNYELFLEKRAEREANEAHAEAKRQNTLKRELAWLQKQPKARGTKQKARKERAEELKQQEGPPKKEEVQVPVGSARLGKKVIEAEDLEKSYGEKNMFSKFNYMFTPGEKIGIVGPNGTGKTTLLNILANRTEPDAGDVVYGPTVKLGYYSQQQEELDESKRVLEYIRDIAEVIYTVNGESISAEQMLERFLFEREDQWTYISRLSGGEKKRVYLLSILMTEPNVLFMDEPTNDLDVQTLSVLEEYLQQFPGVVVTVSHDRYFLDRVAEKLFVFDESSQVTLFEGNYTEFMSAEKDSSRPALSKEKKTEPEAISNAAGEKKKMSYKEKQEWDQIEEHIARLEDELAEAEQQMEESGSDLEAIEKWSNIQKETNEKLDQAMTRWAELSEIAEKQ